MSKKTVTQGNVYFNGDTGQLVRYSKSLTKAIMEGTINKMYAKIQGDKSNNSYLSMEHMGSSSFGPVPPKTTKYPKFEKLSADVQFAMFRELYMLFGFKYDASRMLGNKEV